MKHIYLFYGLPQTGKNMLGRAIPCEEFRDKTLEVKEW